MWGPGGCPQHPYLAEPRFGSTLNRSEQDAAMQARQAATVLGPDLVSQRLNEAARFGNTQQVQEAARLAAAEAHHVMADHQRRSMASVVALPSPRTTEVSPARSETVRPIAPVSANSAASIAPIKTIRMIRQVAPSPLTDEIWEPVPVTNIPDATNSVNGLGDFCRELEIRLKRMGALEYLFFQPLAYTTFAPFCLWLVGLSLQSFLIVSIITAFVGVGLGTYFFWDDERE